MEVAEQQFLQQQWQKEEEKEGMEEVEEATEEEVAVEALQGRRSRHPAAAAVSDASSGGEDEMLTYSEPVHGFAKHESRQEELQYQNGNNNDSNGVELDSEQKSEQNVYYDEDEGTEPVSGFSATANSGIQGSASERNSGDDGFVVTIEKVDIQTSLFNHQYKEDIRDDNLSDFRLQPSENSPQENKTNESLSEIAEARDEIELIKEIDKELTELDVERVLEKQDTHDLYCPNCNSCITRRVILRKRKRNIRTSGEDIKRNKLETVVASELDAISAHASNDRGRHAADISFDGSTTPAADDNNRDREPEIFRCLSCFSFFIPTGKGFKLFNIFGEKREKENMQSPQPISAVKKNWLSSFFASRKEEMTVDQGSGREAYADENIVGASKQEVPSQSFGAQGLVKSSVAEPQDGGVDIVPSSTEGPKLVGEVMADYIIKNGAEGAGLDNHRLDTIDQLDTSSFLNETLSYNGSNDPATQLAGRTPVHTAEPAESVISKPRQDGLKILVHTSAESLTPEQSRIDEKVNVAIERKSAGTVSDNVALAAVQNPSFGMLTSLQNNYTDDDEDSKLLKPVPVFGESVINGKVTAVADFPSENGQTVGATLHTTSIVETRNVEVRISETTYSSEVSQNQNAIIGTKVDIHMQETLKSDKDAFSLSVHDALLLQDGRLTIPKESKDTPAKSSAGSDTIIFVREGSVEPATSQEARDNVTSAETVPLTHTESAEAREFRGLEIVKSMVYGGLIESITSLGIVSSAAAADATTLNILALGLANLVGGLFFIGHNLWDLKNDDSVGASNQVTEGASTNQVTTRLDRYQELLGRRDNFLLHATVAVLSFLIFGLIPPVVYGFSFRESNNRDFKLLAVAVSSLLCIIVLATGKVYVQNPPKAYIKTVMYYVIMAVMASGVSYAAGDLVQKLLHKLGLFDSTLVLTLPVLETKTPVQPAWGSY